MLASAALGGVPLDAGPVLLIPAGGDARMARVQESPLGC